jgi:hypothetical protein
VLNRGGGSERSFRDPMARDFIQKLDKDVGLNEVELAVLEDLRIATPEELYSLARNFPTLGKEGMNFPKLTSAVSNRISKAFVDGSQSAAKRPPSRLSGAKPPPGATTVRPGYGVPLRSLGQRSSRETTRRTGDSAEPSGSEVGGPAEPLSGESIDLRVAEWPVRDQGSRGTCVAFAVVACREHLIAGSQNVRPPFPSSTYTGRPRRKQTMSETKKAHSFGTPERHSASLEHAKDHCGPTAANSGLRISLTRTMRTTRRPLVLMPLDGRMR